MDLRHVSYSVTSSLSGTIPALPVTVRYFTFSIFQRHASLLRLVDSSSYVKK